MRQMVSACVLTPASVLGLAVALAGLWSAAGCAATGAEEDFPARMCAVMADGEEVELDAAADPDDAPELSITGPGEDGVVHAVAGLSDAGPAYAAFTPEEDGELVLFADTEGVVLGLLEDGAAASLPEGSPNGECEAAIPEHWHLEDLRAGTRYALELGPTAVSGLRLVLAVPDGEVDHGDGG